MSLSNSSSPLLVAGLCAQWCSACRAWRPLFDEQARTFGGQADFAWIDIEDHDEVLGPLDVDNFPTLLIARGDEVLFFGAITPHAQTLARLVERAAQGDLRPLADAQYAGLPRRVRSAM